MRRLRTRRAVREAVDAERARGRRVALVPTMGYLHEGHLSLVDVAREHADAVVLSIYVNPIQFAPSEDLADYPRDVDRDAALAEERGVDMIFAPADAEMYPGGEPGVRVAPGPLADRLCGAFRPGHFEGVLTVVAKLLNIVRPDVAVFGRKDFQQAVLIRRMVADLDFDVAIETAPIVREPDGLALSSRNEYLDADERRRSTSLCRGLRRARDAFRAGERDAGALVRAAREVVEAEPGVRPQYVELVDADTLEPVRRAAPGTVLALAAFVGETRLIDNLVLEE